MASTTPTDWYSEVLIVHTCHSSPLSLAARLHQCHANHSYYINNGWTFSRQTLCVCVSIHKYRYISIYIHTYNFIVCRHVQAHRHRSIRRACMGWTEGKWRYKSNLDRITPYKWQHTWLVANAAQCVLKTKSNFCFSFLSLISQVTHWETCISHSNTPQDIHWDF